MAVYDGRGAHGQMVEFVGRRILAGALREGQTIDVAALEGELGISRTVVRESLRVLEAKGLVGARQKRGTFVRPRTDWNLLDADILRWQFAGRSDGGFFQMLHEVRSIVEPAGARLAAQRRTDADLQALDDALAAMAEAGEDAEAAVAADLRFHRVLLGAAHNELLERMEVVIETGLFVRDQFAYAGDAEDRLPAHRAVLDAVRRGSPAKAERCMRILLDQAVKDLSGLRLGDPDGDAEPAVESTDPGAAGAEIDLVDVALAEKVDRRHR
ncbi:FadR/GntR family transcriptional regulator [Actinopolymorpha pittospori]|uniref:DNA-binding FadR family transcriptional regulator n=1 Tax=Actinopolymorpha pittospori TaxID=648752 RepID=A0A927MV10_9ACTN|nr:FCD domain-containing protein [Actinopolymorpha pittospori]MBE1603820.1 DNA-binding FadR family transcriptional regulator [Actinopolymorpha pittospori]